MTTTLKTCFKCGESKPYADFYKHKIMADGHLGKCKQCTKMDVKENREKRSDHYQLYDRLRDDNPDRVQARAQYAASEAGRSATRTARKAWLDRNPERDRIRWIFSNAVRDNRVWISPCCTAPGCFSQDRLHGHHTSYSDPLCVVWLCSKCHSKLHRDFNRSRKGQAL